MEGGNEGLCLLCCTHWSLSLDCDDWGVGRGGFSNSGLFLRTESGDVSLLIALKTESALNPLSFFFVCECGPCPSVSNVHSIWIAIIEHIPPLGLCCSPPVVVSPDSFLQEYIFLLMCLRSSCPVIHCDLMVELDTICH